MKKAFPMETNKEAVFNCTVIDVKYQIAPSGKLNAVMFLKPSEHTQKYDINALVYDSLIECKNLGFGVGSKGCVKLNIEENTINYAPEEHRIMPPAPLDCPVCQCPLSTPKGLERACLNPTCSGTNRGYIYRLIYASKGGVHEDYYQKFVTQFVINNEKISLDSIDEFKYIFNQKGLTIFTPMNLHQWEKHHPIDGRKLFELENILLEYLQAKYKSREDFWMMAGMPSISQEDFKELKNVDPTNLESKNVNDNIKKALNVNADFVEWFLNFFKVFQSGTIWE